jgi:hypothetical protein
MDENAFKQFVMQYCEIDDRVKEHNKQIKELKASLKDITESIMNYMSERSLEVCKAGDHGVLTLKTVTSKAPLNLDTIRENLSKVLSDEEIMSKSPEEIANSGAEYIVNNRDTEEKKSLRRTMIKSKKA